MFIVSFFYSFISFYFICMFEMKFNQSINQKTNFFYLFCPTFLCRYIRICNCFWSEQCPVAVLSTLPARCHWLGETYPLPHVYSGPEMVIEQQYVHLSLYFIFFRRILLTPLLSMSVCVGVKSCRFSQNKKLNKGNEPDHRYDIYSKY